MVVKVLSSSPEETQQLAGIFAQHLINGATLAKARPVIISLEGQLGSGKTEFIKGFALALGVSEKVLSPTFLIMKKFNIKAGPYTALYHLDCYRIKNSKEILSLDYKEIVKDRKAIVLIEWGNLIKDILSKDHLEVSFKAKSRRNRLLTFNI